MICSLNFILFQCILQAARTPLRIWAGSVPHWGVWLTIVRWVCIENSKTKSTPGVHSPDRGLSQAKPVLGSHVYFFGWLAMPPPVNAHHWMASQNKSCNSASHIQVASQPRGQSIGFAWDKPRFGLWTPGGDFVFKFSLHTHRTIVSQPPRWGTEPGQIGRGVRRCLKNTLQYDDTQWTNPQNTPIL